MGAGLTYVLGFITLTCERIEAERQSRQEEFDRVKREYEKLKQKKADDFLGGIEI